MSDTTGSPLGGQFLPLCSAEPANQITLLDLFAQAAISGNSMAAELSHYLNTKEATFSSVPKESLLFKPSSDDADIHQRALNAILEVVTANSNASCEYVLAPEPQGGVQEWWAGMLSGSLSNSQSASGCPAIGESL